MVEVVVTVDVEDVATEADAIDLDGKARTTLIISLGFVVEDAETAVEEGVVEGEGTTDPVVGDLIVAEAALVGVLEDVTSLKVSAGLTRATGSSSLHQHMEIILFPVLLQNKDD